MGVLRFGEFTFDDETRLLLRAGQSVHLTPKAFDLLGILIGASPRAMRKDELRDHLWPDVVVDESNLKSLVAEIRSALGDRAVIRTVHRFGYAFAADKAAVASSPATARLIDRDRIYKLHAGENVIGRDDDCAVILDFTGVSRRHAKITVAADRVILADLDSKNGTWRNDVRLLEPVELSDGDRIRLGPLRLIFRSALAPLPTATVQP